MVRRATLLRVILVAISLLLAVGCPQDPDLPQDEDTTAPTVSVVQPQANASNVALNTSVGVTFSEDVDSATVGSSSFALTWLSGGAPTAVAATVTAAGATATLTPSASLAYATTYTATVGTAVTDAAGNALAEAYVWSFTTGSEPDVVPPAIASRAPAGDATAVETTESISVAFTEPVASSGVSQETLGVSRANGLDISGSVALSSDGLTLTFTPTIELPLMTVCVVTLQAGLADLAGNAMASGATWSFTTRDGAWEDPELLQALTGPDYNGTPQVAFDGVGTAHVLWSGYHSDSGDFYYTYAKRYDASQATPWSASTTTLSGIPGSSPAISYYTQPALASNMRGTAMAVWQETGSYDDEALYWSRYASGAWSTPTAIAYTSVLSSYYSTLHGAMDMEGNVLGLGVGYCSARSCYRVYFTLYSAATGDWSMPTPISPEEVNSYNPFVALDTAGNGYAVWMDDGPADEVYAHRYDGASEGWPGSSKQISATSMYPTTQPRAAVDGEGNVVAAWLGHSYSQSGNANRYDAGTSWDAWGTGTDEPLGGSTLVLAGHASVAADLSGNALVGWPTGDGFCLELYEPGSGWNTSCVGVGTGVLTGRVAFDGSGNAVVVWAELVDDASTVKARRFLAGSSWAEASWQPAEILYGPLGTPDVQFLELATDPNGSLIAVWCDGLEVHAVAFR